MQTVKKVNGLHWLHVFPGDWHLLYNYQKVMMKVYWDAGLLQLAQAAGYNGAALTSLSNAKSFRRTHHFFMQVFEAFYVSFVNSFFDSHLKEEDRAKLHKDVHPFLIAIKTAHTHEDLEDACHSLVYEPSVRTRFTSYIKAMTESHVMCLFWHRFLETDLFGYIALFVAIRNCDWNLRLASIKLMAPIFFAFDRPIYKRLVATHLVDILCMPPELLKYFEDNGAFGAHITSRSGHATAMDETHEMVINKIIKSCITRPNPELIEHTSLALPFRSDCQKQLKNQVRLGNKADYFIEERKSVKVANSNVDKILW